MQKIEENIQTMGLVAELTNSQTENFIIIQNHWRNFNEELKKYKLSQNFSNWEKYGITYKIAEKYFYLASVPKSKQVFPPHFIYKEILKGKYEIFTHRGNMQNIKHTIYEIYKNILPKSNLKIETHAKAGLIHFEKYDKRFNWNSPDSIIEIYLPLED